MITCAVRCVKVVAEDLQMVPATDGDLGDEGHDVVGDSDGVLADDAGLVGPNRVEITQEYHVPLLQTHGAHKTR